VRVEREKVHGNATRNSSQQAFGDWVEANAMESRKAADEPRSFTDTRPGK
jgi:hypothetical protein